MNTLAVVLQQPERLVLDRLDLQAPGAEDIVVDVEWSGISTGTERLLWSGRMPDFPGMGYPLVPGYETVGRVARNCPSSKRRRLPAATAWSTVPMIMAMPVPFRCSADGAHQ